MASILDNAIVVGKESTYGSAATLTRAYEGKADTFKRSQEYLDSVGFRGGMHAQLSTRSVPINMGGEGSIEVDVSKTGFGLLFQSMLGTVSGPTQQAATVAYKSTFNSSAAGPTDSWTVQVQRVDSTGTVRSFTHLGAVMTNWSLSQEVGGLLMAEFGFDFQDVVTNVATASPLTYPNALPFHWGQASATWNSVPIDLTNFSLEADLGYKTDRRFLRGNVLKKQPVRASVPTFTGSADMEFEGLTHYNAFVAGTVAPLVVTWQAETIASTYKYEVKLTLPAIQFTGDSPEVSLDEIGKQTLPFKALWDSTNPAVTLEYTSTDTSL